MYVCLYIYIHTHYIQPDKWIDDHSPQTWPETIRKPSRQRASADGPGAWGRGPASAPAQGGCVATSQSGHYPLVI